MKARMLAGLLALGLGTAGLGAVPLTADAAPDPNLKIDAVVMNKTAVAVSGLNTVAVTVTVTGKFVNSEDSRTPVLVNLQRTAGSGQEQYLISTSLPRLANGTWSGPLYVPSTANGTYKVTGVIHGPYFPGSGDMTEPTPFSGPSLAITGTHVPRVTASVNPKVVPFGKPYTIKWAVTDSQTGKPYGSRLRVMLGDDNICAEYVGPGYSNLTDTNGVVLKSYSPAQGDYLNCLLLPGNPAAVGGLGLVVARPGVVSAVPSKTSAKVGTIVPVSGVVAGAPGNCSVYLQRLYGATQWRTVSPAAKIRYPTGKYTVNAQPAYKGLIPYRVYFPRCYRYQTGVSKVFYIRGL